MLFLLVLYTNRITVVSRGYSNCAGFMTYMSSGFKSIYYNMKFLKDSIFGISVMLSPLIFIVKLLISTLNFTIFLSEFSYSGSIGVSQYSLNYLIIFLITFDIYYLFVLFTPFNYIAFH